MRAIIYPSKSTGVVTIPTSKSVAHRLLICAALSNGESIISNVSMNNDIIATISCLNELGADIIVDGSTVIVKGIKETKKEVELNAIESGSTLRFLIPLSSYLSKKVIFKGTKKLISRPLDIYQKLYGKDLVIGDCCITINNSLSKNYYEIDGSISSQFISGLLFYLPLIKNDSEIKIINEYESKSYVDLTIDALSKFGIEIKEKDHGRRLLIKGNQTYISKNLSVEGDYSQAAFFLTLGAINNEITIKGLNESSKQGDKAIVNVLRNANVKMEIDNNGITVKKSEIKAIDVDLKDIPDLGPILSVLFSRANGKSRLYNAKRLRYKESDRILAIETELKKMGVEISSDENNIYINGVNKLISNDVINSHNDHRIFMAISILATISNAPVAISNYECINKSYPCFLDDLQRLGIKVVIENE